MNKLSTNEYFPSPPTPYFRAAIVVLVVFHAIPCDAVFAIFAALHTRGFHDFRGSKNVEP